MTMNEEHSPIMHAARFSFFALGFLIFAWFSYFLALAGLFSLSVLAVFGVLILVGTAASARKWLAHETPILKAVFLFSILFSGALMYFAEPTVFSGRDQGSISEAALLLAENHRFESSSPVVETFFSIYGPGKALNFPGFFYTDRGTLLTQFPLGYTSWLGAFDTFFGIDGFRVGNGIIAVLSLLSMFFLVRTFSDDRYAAAATALTAGSFFMSWFSKFTLTENLALFLFLFLSLNLVLFLREARVSFFLGAYFSALLFSVTRIEGLWMLLVALAVLFLSKAGRTFSASQKLLFRALPLSFVALVLLANFIGSIPFYITMAKALLKNITVAEVSRIDGNAEIFTSLWVLFVPYGLALVFLSGFIGIAFLAYRRRWDALIPALLALPTFLYFADPNITHDHPWMLRRFFFSLWPTLLFSATVALAILLAGKRRMEAIVLIPVFILALAAQLPAFSKTFLFAENRGLIDQTEKIVSSIGENDLLLVDREVSGDPFSMPAGPARILFGKNAVYFFNWEDYARIPEGKYDHIYLLAAAKNTAAWQQIPARFTTISEFTFSTEQFETLPIHTPRFPGKRPVSEDALLFELTRR